MSAGEAAERTTPPREIGPVGTAARVVGGLLAIVVPIALDGLTWWDVGAAVVALPLIATAVAALVRQGCAPHAWSSAVWSSPALLVLGSVVGIGVALTFVTPLNGGVALWSFLGLSMLVAAARGQAGCEVLAIPNVLSRREDRIGCLVYAPVDAAEAMRGATAEPRRPTIELLYFDGCPSYEKLLPTIERLATETRAALELRRVDTPEAAASERFLGSPTIRVNGADVDLTAPDRTDFGIKCRIYRSHDGQSPLPPERWIYESLARAEGRSR